MTDKITCPKCGYEFPVTEAISNKLREEISKNLEAEYSLKKGDLKRKYDEDLNNLRKEIDKQVLEKVKGKENEIRSDISKELEDKYNTEIQSLSNQVENKDKKISEFIERELKLIAEKNKLDEEKRELSLTVAREVNEKTIEIREKTAKEVTEKFRTDIGEKDKKILDLQKALDEAQRKASSGSALVRGEIQEISLEDVLKQSFPVDEIKPVPRGKPGADIVHMVRGTSGLNCGVILWEAKYTKNWNDEWLSKIRENLREIKANIGVIVSEAMPSEIDTFGRKDKVWITKFEYVIPFSMVLREVLIATAYERATASGKGEKAEILYNYITSHEFHQKVDAMVEAFKNMWSQLGNERMVMEKNWKRREMEIRKLVSNTVALYGDIQALVDSSLPEIKGLELSALESGGGS